MSSLTSASASFLLTLAPAFPIAQKLQGWDTDDQFVVASVKRTQSKMGADGQFHAGFIYEPYEMDLSILPDSPSVLVFDGWDQYQQLIQDVLYATASISLPAVGKRYICTRGVLDTNSIVPGAKKILEVQKYKITWGSIVPVAL
jgi:hypothetical protein